MIRLFTALEIPPEISDKLVQLQQGLDGARWIEPHDFHVTLRFLGDIPENLADDADEALSHIPMAPFPIEIEGLGEFGGAEPRALWARVKPSEPLRILQGRHESAMRRIGLKPETRNYLPHITIARLKRADPGDVARFIQKHNLFATPTFTATRFALFSSRASKGGGPYVIEKTYPEDAFEPDEEWADDED